MAKAGKAVKAAAKPKTPVRKSGGPNPVDVHVGGRVRLRRMIMGMSQEALGKALGLTFQQIQKYEKGANRIGASRLYELSKLLDVPVQFFYDDYAGGEPGAAPGMAESDAAGVFMELAQSPEIIQLCKVFSQIKEPQVRKRILDLIKSIAESG